MAFPPNFLEEIRARVSISDVISKKIKLIKKGKTHWGCCPFHNEKTPSFSINDTKGFYHCFGCGAHGDIFSFEMNANHLSFFEAVEKLCAMAGLKMPETSAEESKKEKEKNSLYDVMELACGYFEKQLRMPIGKQACDYLKRRGLPDDVISHYRLGYAAGDGGLKSYLSDKNVTDDQMVALGLAGFPDDGRKPYDYFRNRVMFPIADKRGRVIAFGGRVMDDSQPKYLNSPDTPLFNKGYVLYAMSSARDEAFDREEIIVCEGYMDVIALYKAGYKNAVAPLGTALTENQIAELWKVTKEPIMCFDGDNAGKKAAVRSAERAIPMLRPGYSLRFAMLEGGLDPDEMIAQKGKETFAGFINNARPLIDILWDKHVLGRSVATPERKAELEKELYDTVGQIGDAMVKEQYRKEIKNKLWNLFNPNFASRKQQKSDNNQDNTELKAKILAPDARASKNIVSHIICFPELFAKWEEDFSLINFGELSVIYDAIANVMIEDNIQTKDALLEKLPDNVSGELKRILGSQIAEISKKQLYVDEVDNIILRQTNALKLGVIEKQIKEISESDSFDADKLKLWQELTKERENILSANIE